HFGQQVVHYVGKVALRWKPDVLARHYASLLFRGCKWFVPPETFNAAFGPDRGMFESNFRPDGVSSARSAAKSERPSLAFVKSTLSENNKDTSVYWYQKSSDFNTPRSF